MSVICCLKLILYEDPSVVCDVLAQNICAKRTNVLLLRLQLKIDSYRVSQELQAAWVG